MGEATHSKVPPPTLFFFFFWLSCELNKTFFFSFCRVGDDNKKVARVRFVREWDYYIQQQQYSSGYLWWQDGGGVTCMHACMHVLRVLLCCSLIHHACDGTNNNRLFKRLKKLLSIYSLLYMTSFFLFFLDALAFGKCPYQ